MEEGNAFKSHKSTTLKARERKEKAIKIKRS